MELTDEEVQWAKDAIRRIDLFSNCTDADMQLLIAGLEKQLYHTGTTILFQGEISSRLYLVETGSVSVWARRGKGKDKAKVAELGPDSYFGEISLLTPRAATASVKAESDAEVVSLPGEVVQKMVQNNPNLAASIHKKIEERLASREQALEEKEVS